MTVTIRALTPADALAFHTLRLQGLRECPTAFSSSVEEEEGLTVEEVAGRLDAREDAVILGAFRAAELAGVVGLQRERQRKMAHKAYLWGMYVAPTARKVGVGRMLVEAALSHAQARLHVSQVNLGVNAANKAAVALYERCGFQPFGFERGFMLVEGELQDEVLMVRHSP